MAESVEMCHLDNGHISYSPSDMIGRGGFGVVYRGFMDVKNFEDQSVAIKRINLSCYTEKARDKEPMVNLKHENFVKIVKVLMDDQFRYLVMEMCTGTLAQVIHGSYKGPNLPSDVSVLRDVASGLHYIHTAKLVHLNIRPENILISKDARMKISDLGFFGCTTRRDNCWLAPEVLLVGCSSETQGDKNISGTVTSSSDIFSAGCVFFVFLTRRFGGIHPFGNDYKAQSHNIRTNRSVNLFRYSYFYHAAPETTDKMIAHNPRDRIQLPEVIEKLETIESREKNSLQEKCESRNLESIILQRDVTKPMTDCEKFLPINEEDHQLIKVKDDTRPEFSEESAVDALVNIQTEIDKNYRLKEEPMDTGNLSCETMNPNIPPITPNNENVSFMVDSRVEIVSEIKEEVETGIEEPMEKSEYFKQTSFPSMKAKKVAFHPTITDLLCCETLEGDVTLLKMSDNSFSRFSCSVKDNGIEKLQGRKPFSVSWNVDGTRLAAGCYYGNVVIWELQNGKIVFSKKLFSFTYPKLEWNPFQPDRLAVYSHKRMSVAIVDAKLLCDPLEMKFRKAVMSIAWVSADKIACGYVDGSLLIYMVSEDCGKLTHAVFKKLINGQVQKEKIVKSIKCLKWSHECNILASSSSDGCVKFWSLNEKKLIFTYRSENGAGCHTLDWIRCKTTEKSPNQSTDTTQQPRLLACGFANGAIIIFNPSESHAVHVTLLGHIGDIDRLLFSPDGKYLMSLALGAKDKTVRKGKEIRIWSTETWTPHFCVGLTCAETISLDWNASSNKLAIASFAYQSHEKARLANKLNIFSVV